jgi:sugar lactone lactonase YvrE
MRHESAGWGWVFLGALLVPLVETSTEEPLPDGAVRRLAAPQAGQRGKGQEVRRLAFGPRGQVLVVVRRASVEVWDAATGRQLRRLATGEPEVVSVAFAPDGETLATGNSERASLWDVGTGQRLRDLDGQAGRGSGLAFSADGRQIVGVRDGATILPRGVVEEAAVLVWDADKGKKLREFFVPRHPESAFQCTVFLSPDGMTLASTDTTVERIQLWDVFSGRPSVRIPAGVYTERPLFSPDGHTLVCREKEGKLGLWEAASAKPRQDADGIFPLAFSPDGRLLAVEVPAGPAVRVHDLARGREVLRTASPPEGTTAAAFSADGRLFACGQADGTVLMWNVSDLLKHDRPVVPLTERGRDGLWDDLGGEDARRAYRAVWELSARPEAAVAFLKEHLRPGKEAARIERLLADLDDDRFETRETAAKEIVRLGAEVLPAVRLTLQGKPSLELRRRLEALLAEPGIHVWSGESLRQVRALEVLEKIGTEDARRAVEVLAKGPEKAVLTHEARAVLARLESRRPRT